MWAIVLGSTRNKSVVGSDQDHRTDKKRATLMAIAHQWLPNTTCGFDPVMFYVCVLLLRELDVCIDHKNPTDPVSSRLGMIVRLRLVSCTLFIPPSWAT